MGNGLFKVILNLSCVKKEPCGSFIPDWTDDRIPPNQLRKNVNQGQVAHLTRSLLAVFDLAVCLF